MQTLPTSSKPASRDYCSQTVNKMFTNNLTQYDVRCIGLGVIWEFASYQTFLRAAFVAKRGSNERYSLRRFASQIGLQPSLLSEILKGTRKLSEAAAAEVAQRLKLSLAERDYLLLLVRLEKTKSPALRALLLEQLGHFTKNKQKIQDLSTDAFMAISDWYHFALLKLMTIEDFDWSAKNAALALGLKEIEVLTALERLERLDLIEIAPNGERPKKLASDIKVNSPTHSNEALKKYHTQILEKAITALSKFTPKQRFTGTETIKLNARQFNECHVLIEECFQKILNLTREPKTGAEVYHLGIHLFPLSNREALKVKK